jgi:GNAT superfamily N-acetyltransferase
VRAPAARRSSPRPTARWWASPCSSTFLTRRGLYLEDLYVRQDHRGKGYGSRILKHLARLAIERECGRFEWSVLDWNTPAIEFYKAMGAEILPDWRICRVTGAPLQALAGD